MKTTVKIWFDEKGYGFLNNGSANSRDIMVHVSALKNAQKLEPGMTVEFDCDFNQKGLVALNVYCVKSDSETTSAKRVRPLFNDHWHRHAKLHR